MPMTFAHPAAVLPLVDRRRGTGWNEALVFGALAPDLLRPLFVFQREATHSVPGLLLLDVPAAILMALVFHRFLASRLSRLPGISRPGAQRRRFRWDHALVAAVFGGATHLAWDLFTHDQAPLTSGGVFDRILFDTVAGPFRLGMLMWYLHSFLGVAAIAGWWAMRIARLPAGDRRDAFLTWLRISAIASSPFVLLLRGFHPGAGTFRKDLFLHVFYFSGRLPHILLAVSSILAVLALIAETRSRGAAADVRGKDPTGSAERGEMVERKAS